MPVDIEPRDVSKLHKIRVLIGMQFAQECVKLFQVLGSIPVLNPLDVRGELDKYGAKQLILLNWSEDSVLKFGA